MPFVFSTSYPLTFLPSHLLPLRHGVLQILAGHRVTRVNPDGLLEVIDRLVEALLHQKRTAEVVVRPGVVRLDPDSFAQVADGLVHTPHSDENARGVVANLHLVRIQRERAFVTV